MSDAKFFQRGKVQEFRQDLIDDKKDSKHLKKRTVLKKIIANMTMGNDMSALFPDVIQCLQIPDLEIKKMIYLYIIQYAGVKSELILLCINSFMKDTQDSNPLIRGLALRTMGYIDIDRVYESTLDAIKRGLKDPDAYVRKTAAISTLKLFHYDKDLFKQEGLLESLRLLLTDGNSTVVSNAIIALLEIHEKSNDENIIGELDMSLSSNLLASLNECSEWNQLSILEILMFLKPKEIGDAESLIERLIPRLQHVNSGVVFGVIKCLIYWLGFCKEEGFVNGIWNKIGSALIGMMNRESEVMYVALKNILLIVQKRPELLKGEMKVFFCKYQDPLFVKLCKLEIMYHLVTNEEVGVYLSEMKEYATEVDLEFVRRSIRMIGKCALKIESAADQCIQVLMELIQLKVGMVAQECMIVMKDVFRKYPNRYESCIELMCQSIGELELVEARMAMIWIVGQYCERIDNAPELLEGLSESFLEEPQEVQLGLLTAGVKLFMKRPRDGKDLVPKLLKMATEEGGVDVRDRAFFYWRMLSTDPLRAKEVVLCQGGIQVGMDLDEGLLDELLMFLNTMPALMQVPVLQFGLRGRGTTSGGANTSQVSTTNNNPYNLQTMNKNVLLDFDMPTPDTPMSAVLQGQSQYGQPSQPSQQYGMSVGGGTVMTGQFTGLSGISSTAQPGLMTGLSGMTAINTSPYSHAASLSTSNTANNILLELGDLNLNLTNTQQQQQQSSVTGTTLNPLYKPWLNAKDGKGLEISGYFSYQSQPQSQTPRLMMQMYVQNKSMIVMNDFGIQFNKNQYGLIPAEGLKIGVLLPGSGLEVSLVLGYSQTHLLPAATNTTNGGVGGGLHVAIKHQGGVVFFMADLQLKDVLLPVHIGQSLFLEKWKSLEQTGSVFTLERVNYSVDLLKQRLQQLRLVIVAERVVNGRMHVFGNTGMIDPSCLFMFELQAILRESLVEQVHVVVRCTQMSFIHLFIEQLKGCLTS